MWRCELILTDKCNFRCPYCRGLRFDCRGTMDLDIAKRNMDFWIATNGLKNIRFSGGEPTVYPHLKEVVEYAKDNGVEHIAISTNGSAKLEYYKELIKVGVNDFSISLDACCSSFGKKMCGGMGGMWERTVNNIKELSKLTYVSLGVVFTKDNINDAKDIVEFAHLLHPTDIRIISAAQYNKVIEDVSKISNVILNQHPILKYRVNHFLSGRGVRGTTTKDYHKCALVIDDSAIAGNFHFPCIIYLREGGNPIGKISKGMRQERYKWFKNHNTYKDEICRKNCLDVCIDYNNKYRDYHE